MKKLVFQAYMYALTHFWLLFRYAVSGVSGIVANLMVFAFLVERLSVWYLYAVVAGFMAAYVVTFTMHKFWTFTATSMERTVSQGFIYLCSALATLAVNSFILFLLVHFAHVWPVLAQALSLGVTAVLSFLFTAHVTFHQDTGQLRTFFQWSETQVRWFARSERRLLCTLGALVILIMWYRYEFFPLAFTNDARGFIEVAELLLGTGTDIEPTRYLKPLGPAAIAFFVWWGAHPNLALLLQSAVGYVALAAAVYFFARQLFKNSWAGFMAAVLVVSSYPMVRYGLDYFQETGAWALYFVSLYGVVRWSEKPSFKLICFISSTLLLGLLWKEYAVLAGAIFAIVILFHKQLSWNCKIHAYLQTACLVLIPWGMWQLYVWYVYDYSYIDWLLVGASGYEKMYVVTAFVKSMFMLLTVAWPLVLLGLWHWRAIAVSARRALTAMAIPSFGFLLWGYVSSRLFFSLVPFAAPLAVHGLLQLKRYSVMILLIVVILLTNALLLWVSFIPSVREFLTQITYG